MRVLLRAVGLCAGLLLVAAAPAPGAFPGANGKIVFVTYRDYPEAVVAIDEIYVANADGSAPTRLTHDGRGYAVPAFSPDGTRIAYQSGSHIFVMDADGTDPVELTPPSLEGGAGSPAFSPDGSRIAFVTRDGIAVMDADGGNLSVSDHVGGEPVWAPDGSRIAFICGAHICTMSPAGGDLQQLSHGFGEANPNYSPDGSRIVYTSFHLGVTGLESEIYVMNADGSDPRRLTFNNESAGPLSTFDLEPVFSPDGKKIAYYSGTCGANICVMNADGTNIKPLTCFAGGAPRSPDWGPLVAPSDAGSGVICNNVVGCPPSGPAGGIPSGCPALVPPTPPGGTGSRTPGGTSGGGSGGAGSIGPGVDRLLASLARELAQAAGALERCRTTGLLRRAGCRDSFTALGPGAVMYRVTAPPAAGREAAVAVIASGRRAIPAAGSYPVRVKATRKGRKRLRKARKLRATLVVTFTDSTGSVAKRSRKVVLMRKRK